MSEKQDIARARNWSKCMICGAQGLFRHILQTKEDVLSEVEKDEIEEMCEQTEELADNWNLGTKKVLNDL